MKKIDCLACDYWIKNTEKIYKENLHVSSPVIKAYEAGFRKAREMAANKFKNSPSPNSKMIYKELLNLGEEDETK